MTTHDVLLKGGRVIDPATGVDATLDLAVTGDRITGLAAGIPEDNAREVIDVAGHLVIAGMIDTHAHVYQHVTGKFGLNPDLVGVRSGVTTLIDQGGPSCMTIGGFRHFVSEPADSRVLAFISAYLVGGLEGHLYPSLYGPEAVDVAHTVRAIGENPDLVRGIKAHAEIGGFSRWGLAVIRLARDIARQTALPLYIHLGQLWPTAEDAGVPDADALVRELVDLMAPGDVLAHPFTRHPGGFVSEETGDVHEVIQRALDRGLRVDVGHGSHFSFDMARRVMEAGIFPDTLGADLHGYNVRMPLTAADDAERAANPFHGVAPFSLTIAMTELLALGMPLTDIVATVTSNAADLIQKADELGSIQVGRIADISVIEPLSGRFRLTDNAGGEALTDTFLHPAFCLRAGQRFDAGSTLLPTPEMLAA